MLQVEDTPEAFTAGLGPAPPGLKEIPSMGPWVGPSGDLLYLDSTRAAALSQQGHIDGMDGITQASMYATMTGMGVVPQEKHQVQQVQLEEKGEDMGGNDENRRLTLTSSDVRTTLRALLENC